MMFSRVDLAFYSWTVDCLQCASVLVLLACWVSDAGNPSTPRFLDPSFLSTGFCNHDTWDTQWTCAMFDFAAGILFVALAFLDDKPSPTTSDKEPPRRSTKAMALPTAAYLFSHGYGHFQVAMKKTEEDPSESPQVISNMDLLILAAIIYIGPVQAGKDLSSVGGFEAYKTLIQAASVAAVAALVLGYKVMLADSHYALLYINISIILTAVLPRCLWIGYSQERHVEFRVDQNLPYFWLRMVTRSYIGAMIVLEPFACGWFIKQAGGHFLFDLSLFLDSSVAWINLREQNKTLMTEDTVAEGDKKTN